MEKILRISLSNSCNYNCIFCHNEGLDKEEKPVHFNEKDISYVIQKAQENRFTKIVITGGEPFLYKNIESTVNNIFDNKGKMKVNIATNLVLAPDELLKKISHKIDKFNINFQANENILFEEITGKDKLTILKEKISFLKKLNSSKLSLNYVFTKKNKNAIDDIIKFAEEEKLDIKILELIKDNNNEFLYQNIDEAIFFLKKNNFFLINEKGSKKTFSNKDINVNIIKSYCNDNNLEHCIFHNEFRLSPDMKLSFCIKSNHNLSIQNIIENKDDFAIEEAFTKFCSNYNKEKFCLSKER